MLSAVDSRGGYSLRHSGTKDLPEPDWDNIDRKYPFVLVYANGQAFATTWMTTSQVRKREPDMLVATYYGDEYRLPAHSKLFRRPEPYTDDEYKAIMRGVRI